MTESFFTQLSVASQPLLLWASRPRRALGFEWLPGGWGVLLKAVSPLVVYLVALPLLYWMFRNTWKQLDADAAVHKMQLVKAGRTDPRPLVLFAVTALVLTWQWYYGGKNLYWDQIRPWLLNLEQAQKTTPGGLGQYVDTKMYGGLYSFGWWSFSRVVGYAVFPLLVWKIVFRKDSLLDAAGLRVRGLLRHAWIYGFGLAIVVPLVYLVSRSPDFANYYPFYKKCSRSWVELLSWEAMYLAQFFALEVFFRGFWLSGLRKTVGSAAIFAMCVPYVMIHYGKPFLESGAALLAGIFLGSLSMKTRSIYSGFILHGTVAIEMDLLALMQKGGLPTQWWPS